MTGTVPAELVAKLSSLKTKMPTYSRDEIGEKVTDAVTQVYESCNFQDITGQRITKVVRALKHIESKVDALVGAFGEDIAKYKAAHPQAAEPAKQDIDPMSDKALLNGPQ